MDRIERFKINESARQLHQQGLDVAKHDPHAAHLYYEKAITRLRTPLHGQFIDRFSTYLQLARIRRDIAFTYVRQALAEEEPELLHTAYEEARQAYITTDNMVGRGAAYYSPTAWQSLMEEHGATGGVRGRIITVAKVMEFDELHQNHDFYEEAHGYLRQGNNPYYLASNAGNAMRHERIEGHELKAGLWVCRSIAAVVRARRTSPRVYEEARSTVAARLPSLVGKASARQSVRQRP